MRIKVYRIGYQVCLLPTIKITYSRFLTGSYELIIAWLNRELTIEI